MPATAIIQFIGIMVFTNDIKPYTGHQIDYLVDSNARIRNIHERIA
jgi:hypothetical protein